MIKRLFSVVRASVLVMGLLLGAPAKANDADECLDLLPARDVSGPDRMLTALDLVRLRDIGFPESSLFRYDHPMTLSPERDRLAFVIRRADPANNTYCNGLIVLDLISNSLRLIDVWRGFLAEPPLAIRQLVVGSGMPAQNRPVWRPDGRALAWLKRADQRTEAWIVDTTTGRSHLAARLASDIESVSWSGDGRSLIVKTRPELAERDLRNADEAGRGFHYDDRFMPNQGDRPLLMEPLNTVMATIAVGDVPTKDGVSNLPKGRNEHGTRSEETVAMGSHGGRAWIAKLDDTLFSDSVVWSAAPNRKPSRCPYQECRGDVFALDWSDSIRSIIFLARRGWKNEETIVYLWNGLDAPKKLYTTLDTLADCKVGRAALLCLKDGPTTPRRLVAIDLQSGADSVLFDPNPEFRSIVLGSVQRLRWKNANGLEAWGDLVLPPGYAGRIKLPLIVVQYHSDGFLRGGTGDEYPIQLFATAGFAVLSIEQPNFIARILPNIRNWDDANREDEIAWRERRSLLSSLETGVAKVIELGVADPSKIGLTGLSDGATTAQFALINSRTFAAASLSSCCIDPNTVMIYGGERWARVNRSRGFPRVVDRDEAFWRPMSLAQNASHIKVPILMQLPSDEYLLGLESFSALRETDSPVELYVFPDERHVKWQPSHRLAVYERSLDWFNYWLRGQEDEAVGKRDQYKRWSRLRIVKDGLSILPGSTPLTP